MNIKNIPKELTFDLNDDDDFNNFKDISSSPIFTSNNKNDEEITFFDLDDIADLDIGMGWDSIEAEGLLEEPNTEEWTKPSDSDLQFNIWDINYETDTFKFKKLLNNVSAHISAWDTLFGFVLESMVKDIKGKNVYEATARLRYLVSSYGHLIKLSLLNYNYD